MGINGRVNGWLVSPNVIKMTIAAVLSVGIWVGTLQADINDKAEKIDVAKQQIAMTKVLQRIDEKLDDLKEAVKDLDERQRVISTDVAAHMAKDRE
jgi:cell division protein FtsL